MGSCGKEVPGNYPDELRVDSLGRVQTGGMVPALYLEIIDAAIEAQDTNGYGRTSRIEILRSALGYVLSGLDFSDPGAVNAFIRAERTRSVGDLRPD